MKILLLRLYTHVRIYVRNYCTWIALDTPQGPRPLARVSSGTRPAHLLIGENEKREGKREKEREGKRRNLRTPEKDAGVRVPCTPAYEREREGGLRHGSTSGHLATVVSLSSNVILFRDVRSVCSTGGAKKNVRVEKMGGGVRRAVKRSRVREGCIGKAKCVAVVVSNR